MLVCIRLDHCERPAGGASHSIDRFIQVFVIVANWWLWPVACMLITAWVTSECHAVRDGHSRDRRHLAALLRHLSELRSIFLRVNSSPKPRINSCRLYTFTVAPM